MLRTWTIAVLFVVGSSCGETDDEPEPAGTTEPFIDVEPVQCVPGSTSMCYCGFLIGEQTCLASGNEKGPCRCDDGPSSGDAGTGVDEPTTSAGSTSG